MSVQVQSRKEPESHKPGCRLLCLFTYSLHFGYSCFYYSISIQFRPTKFEEFDLKVYLLQDKQTKLYNGKLVDEEYNWNVFYPVWKSLTMINLN